MLNMSNFNNIKVKWGGQEYDLVMEPTYAGNFVGNVKDCPYRLFRVARISYSNGEVQWVCETDDLSFVGNSAQEAIDKLYQRLLDEYVAFGKSLNLR